MLTDLLRETDVGEQAATEAQSDAKYKGQMSPHALQNDFTLAEGQRLTHFYIRLRQTKKKAVGKEEEDKDPTLLALKMKEEATIQRMNASNFQNLEKERKQIFFQSLQWKYIDLRTSSFWNHKTLKLSGLAKHIYNPQCHILEQKSWIILEEEGSLLYETQIEVLIFLNVYRKKITLETEKWS